MSHPQPSPAEILDRLLVRLGVAAPQDQPPTLRILALLKAVEADLDARDQRVTSAAVVAAPASNRHDDALFISDGACNPRAIIHALERAVTAIPMAVDTPGVCSDPALKLMVHQLAYLLQIPTAEKQEDWQAWRDACEALRPPKPVRNAPTP